jgi:hypothetical protein
MGSWWGAVATVMAALIGDGALRRYFRTRSEQRNDDASAVSVIQEATASAVRTVSASADDAVRWARADAQYAKDQANAAHEEVRKLQLELTQARQDLMRLRAETEAGREAMQQDWMRKVAERDATIAAQAAELAQLRAAQWPAPMPDPHTAMGMPE